MDRETSRQVYNATLQNIREKFGTDVIPLQKVADDMNKDTKTLRGIKDFPIKKIGGQYYVIGTKLAAWYCE